MQSAADNFLKFQLTKKQIENAQKILMDKGIVVEDFESETNLGIIGSKSSKRNIKFDVYESDTD